MSPIAATDWNHADSVAGHRSAGPDRTERREPTELLKLGTEGPKRGPAAARAAALWPAAGRSPADGGGSDSHPSEETEGRILEF
jgi:hypothetical protein